MMDRKRMMARKAWITVCIAWRLDTFAVEPEQRRILLRTYYVLGRLPVAILCGGDTT